MEGLNTYDKIREVARLYGEGWSIEEIARVFDAPKIAIANTLKLICDITTEIEKSPLFGAICEEQDDEETYDNEDIPEDDGPDFLAMGGIMRSFIADNFVDAIVTEEYYTNRYNEAIVTFTEKSGEYSLTISKEEKK